jgi:hypothetical protein
MKHIVLYFRVLIVKGRVVGYTALLKMVFYLIWCLNDGIVV